MTTYTVYTIHITQHRIYNTPEAFLGGMMRRTNPADSNKGGQQGSPGAQYTVYRIHYQMPTDVFPHGVRPQNYKKTEWKTV